MLLDNTEKISKVDVFDDVLFEAKTQLAIAKNESIKESDKNENKRRIS